MEDLASRLTDAERNFLQQLFEESRPPEVEVESGAQLPFDPVNIDRRLLLTLLNGADAEVMAADGRHRFRFKLELHTPPFGGEPRLRFGTPEIVDRQGVERAARVRPIDSEIRVQDRSGRLQPVAVANISESGMALMVREPTAVGAVLSQLELALPGGQPLPIDGRVVRVEQRQAPEHRLGIAFNTIAPSAREALRRYVFERHMRAAV